MLRPTTDFAPTAYELEFIKAVGRLMEDKKLRVMDCWCGECGKYRYMLEVDGKTDYLCLSCRLDTLGP